MSKEEPGFLQPELPVLDDRQEAPLGSQGRSSQALDLHTLWLHSDGHRGLSSRRALPLV